MYLSQKLDILIEESPMEEIGLVMRTRELH